MNNTIFTKTFPMPPFDRKEILRYASVRETDAQTEELLCSCLDEIKDKLTYKVCYITLPVSVNGDTVDLSFKKVTSASLGRNLAHCKSYVLFAATIGLECDRLISRYASLSPSRALMFQAIGAERIESLCNLFCKEIKETVKKDGKFTVARFSPGYGDFPLEIQKDFFTVLDPSKRIGLCLNESLIMSPSKSVTAIMGISEKENCDKISQGCALCSKIDCQMRRKV